MLRGAVREGARYRKTTTANKSHEGGRELFLSRVREQSLEKRGKEAQGLVKVF